MGRLEGLSFHELLLESTRIHGFAAAATVDIDLARDEFAKHVSRYDAWLSAGHAGAMSYLARGRDRRANPRLVFPEAQSILCVLKPYPSKVQTPAEKPGAWYARYLQGGDYHHEVAVLLEKTMDYVKACTHDNGADPMNSDLKWKVCVDTSAVLERSWAALAGLGWIGKNSLLIHPKLGSYVFIGCVLINRETGQGPKLLPSFCGHCSRCLTACPTQAFKGPGELDSNRCVSYWTLEKRGALEISDQDREAVGPRVAGCDICQEVCPFNEKPARSEPTSSPRPLSAIDLHGWQDLLDENEDHYSDRTKHSALNRIKPSQFSRNLAIAISNLESAALISQLLPAIRIRASNEKDPVARVEWNRCLEKLQPRLSDR